MSNRRQGPRAATPYRTGYLRSYEWFARRDRWFKEQLALTEVLSCSGCGREATRRHLELHHVDYTGVTEEDGHWRAQEKHSDLTAMHPACHELLHRIIDRDPVLSKHRSRRAASAAASRIVRVRFGEKETDQ